MWGKNNKIIMLVKVFGVAVQGISAQMSSKLIREFVQLDTESENRLKTAINRLNLSARAYDKILKVARTIADMDNSENVKPNHISEAINYRNLDREGWGG
jgi:magnesium chelatase family protein